MCYRMMMVLKNRHQVKTKEISQIEMILENTYDTSFFSKKSVLEFASLDGIKVLLVDGTVDFFYAKDQLIITLPALERYSVALPFVVVDMGAVKFVTNGADVMIPGIVSVESSFDVNAVIGVVDEVHRKYLSVGRALMNSSEMQAKSSGKGIENLHYVGDDLWMKIHTVS